jgi:hypothetical protein
MEGGMKENGIWESSMDMVSIILRMEAWGRVNGKMEKGLNG